MEKKFESGETPSPENPFKGVVNVPLFKPRIQRNVDKYGRDEISDRIEHFAAHSTARGVNPTIEVILDWLYDEHEYGEKDDFVKIDRLIEILKMGKATPKLILEVLEYASKVEKAAIEVYDDFHALEQKYKSMKHLKDALDLRLEVRKDETEKG